SCVAFFELLEERSSNESEEHLFQRKNPLQPPEHSLLAEWTCQCLGNRISLTVGAKMARQRKAPDVMPGLQGKEIRRKHSPRERERISRPPDSIPKHETCNQGKP